jgi:hypothetical protein
MTTIAPIVIPTADERKDMIVPTPGQPALSMI